VRGALAVGRQRERWGVGFSVAGLKSDGISKADEDDGNREADGYETLTAGLLGRAALTEAIELDARLRWQRSETDIDGYPFPDFILADTNDVAESESWSGVVRAVVQGPLGFEHALSLSAYELDRSQDGESFYSRYTADRRVWRWTAERDRAEDFWGLALGVEREDTEADLSDASRADLSSTAVFGVLRLRPVERLNATFSLRHDAPDGYDAETTARAAAVYDLGAGFSLKGSFGQGFKTPSISQAACDFCFPAGPADLTPEKAEGWDIGLAWNHGRFDAAVTAFALDVEDQIAYVAGRYVNIAETRSRGFEAEGGAELGGGFDVRATYAYTDAEDGTTGARLQRVPEHQGSVSVWWTGERGRAALTVRGESEQADIAPDFSPADRDGFVTADLTGGWKLTDEVEATFKLKNLTDADFQEVLGFGEVGRSAYVGLRLRY
jgi:vitamin B12 transporter